MIALLSIFVFTLLISLIKLESFQNNGYFSGLVIEKKNSYVILFDGIEKIYYKCSDSKIDLFDIIKVKGEISELSFKKPLESSFDFKSYLNYSGVNRQIVSNEYTTLLNLPINIVEIKCNILDTFNNEKCRELVSCFILNSKDYESELILHLKNLGLINLLSLSGLYISGIHYLFFKILNKKLSKPKAYLVSLFILLPLIFLNINRMSILRVFINQIITLIALFKGAKMDRLSIRSFSYLLILLFDRYMIFNQSIIISLIIGYPMYFSGLLLYKKKKVTKKIVSSLIFIVLIIPFNIYYNYSFNILNLLVFIALTPTLKFVVIGLYSIIFFPKIGVIETIFSYYYDFLILIDFKTLNINLNCFNQIEYLIYYLIVFSSLYFFEVNYKKIGRRFSLSLIAIVLFRCIPMNSFYYYEVYFINVGQGDSTLIRVNGENILIDTGGNLYNDLAINSLIPFFRKNKIYQIDRVYITHYDNDHYYALDSLKKNFIVKNIYDYNNFKSSLNYNFKIYNYNDIYLNYVDENMKSLILGFQLKNMSFLIMGDAPKEVEMEVLSKHPNLTADILKVGHHGSKTSTDERFIKAIKPKEAIISCGENNIYHHPNEEVIKILETNNVKIRRTDIEGTISYKIFK